MSKTKDKGWAKSFFVRGTWLWWATSNFAEQSAITTELKINFDSRNKEAIKGRGGFLRRRPLEDQLQTKWDQTMEKPYCDASYAEDFLHYTPEKGILQFDFILSLGLW